MPELIANVALYVGHANVGGMSSFARAPLAAILGPTNTGKTHLAVERMCGHSSGMMGFPLRLLAAKVTVFISEVILSMGVRGDGTRIIDLADGYQFDVAAECSGIRSLSTMLALASVVAFMSFRRPWKRVLVIAAAFPVAVVSNVKLEYHPAPPKKPPPVRRKRVQVCVSPSTLSGALPIGCRRAVIALPVSASINGIASFWKRAWASSGAPWSWRKMARHSWSRGTAWPTSV